MSEIDEAITKLCREWYDIIGRDHHKDRDCHFVVEKRWSYGNPPVYTVIHTGYIQDFSSPAFSSYKEAATWLYRKLAESVVAYQAYGEDDE